MEDSVSDTIGSVTSASPEQSDERIVETVDCSNNSKEKQPQIQQKTIPRYNPYCPYHNFMATGPPTSKPLCMCEREDTNQPPKFPNPFCYYHNHMVKGVQPECFCPFKVTLVEKNSEGEESPVIAVDDSQFTELIRKMLSDHARKSVFGRNHLKRHQHSVD